MAARNTEGAPNAGDDLDDLLNFDLDENILNVIDATKPAQQTTGNQGAGLGLDEEVKITKKRAPVAKLDDERLLSQAGIPKLRTLVKDRLVLKGKGHEFDDVSRILEMYQLWMDDLYPRAKMADGLAIIEKLGHSKRMQMLRRYWIDEGKPRDTSNDIFIGDTETDAAAGKDQDEEADPFAHLTTTAATAEAVEDDPSDDEALFVTDRSKPAEDVPMDDLDELLAAESCNTPILRTEKPVETDDQPMEDDLDVLLAEEGTHSASQPSARPRETEGKTASNDEEDFADDMEAMGGMW